jgi:hypothetical protein
MQKFLSPYSYFFTHIQRIQGKCLSVYGTANLGSFAVQKIISEDAKRYKTVYISVKGTVWPDWISLRVVSLESPLKGHQLLYVFNF